MSPKRAILTMSLIFIVIAAAYSFLQEGRYYITKNYFQTDDFLNGYEQFQRGLEQYVLNEIDVEQVKDNLTVSDDEIERYRLHYGRLADQIENIKTQYKSRVEDSTLDEDVRNAYIEERDAKIAEVQRNFDDADYVRDKLLKEKAAAVDRYMAQRERKKAQWLQDYRYFSYEFYDEKEREFTYGNVLDRHVFKQTFGPNNSIFNSDAVDRQFNFAQYSNMVGIANDANIQVYNEDKQFTGTITISQTKLNLAPFAWQYKSFQTAQIIHFSFWAFGIVAFILLLTKCKPSVGMLDLFPRAREKFERLPIDVRAAVLAIAAIVAYSSLYNVSSVIHRISAIDWRYFEPMHVIEWLVSLVGTALLVWGTLIVAYWLVDVLRDDKQRLVQWQTSFTMKFVRVAEQFFYNRSIGLQMLVLLVVVFLGGFGFAIVAVAPGAILVYAPLFLFIFMPVLLIFMRRMGYLNRIMKHTEQLAEGRLTSDLAVKGKSPFAQHATHLNALRDGVRSSMNEQAKSERLKTELITNVSHDLRTPLTSIITYTDLLKNPALSEEERMKYVDIVDMKSARLKTLIEDLFEVSRMASGNIELYKERIDLAQLLQQGIGEHEEDFMKAGLDLRVDIAQQPIYAYVDGQKWWRVIDNLVINARKYSLPSTRVYVSLKIVHGEAQFVVKNVSSYELGGDAIELTERFKRGDASRHTEGSGLGLAIAQSIVDLHGGKMSIDMDGDLFKVTVSVATLA